MRNRAGLWLIELVIAMGVFCFCAAICMGIFVKADQISKKSAEQDQAVVVARVVSEYFHATHGNIPKMITHFQAKEQGQGFQMAFDQQWNLTSDVEQGSYFLNLEQKMQLGYCTAQVEVIRQDGTMLCAWPLAVEYQT